MSANTVNAVYTLEGCRAGETVLKIFKVNGMGKIVCYEYSDNLTTTLPNGIVVPDDTGRTEGACPISTNLESTLVRPIAAATPGFSDGWEFSTPMSSITVYNGTEDIMTLTTYLTTGVVGNRISIINPGSSIDVSFNNNTISEILVQLDSTNGGYWFSNALYDR